MTTKSVLFALMAMWGVTSTGCLPAMAEDATAPMDDSDDAADAVDDDGLTGRVWVRSDTGDDLPGSMQVFLADGTLVTDSCWETYRLSSWKWADAQTLSWDEDGMTITAKVQSLSPDELVLVLDAGGGTEQKFAPAKVPYVCPDMPR